MSVQWRGPGFLGFARESAWLDFFNRVTEVTLAHDQTSDAQLDALYELRELEALTVQCSTKVSAPAIDRFQQEFPGVAVVRPGNALACGR